MIRRVMPMFNKSMLVMMLLSATVAQWSSLSGSVGGGVTANGTFDDIKLATTASLAVNLYWK